MDTNRAQLMLPFWPAIAGLVARFAPVAEQDSSSSATEHFDIGMLRIVTPEVLPSALGVTGEINQSTSEIHVELMLPADWMLHLGLIDNGAVSLIESFLLRLPAPNRSVVTVPLCLGGSKLTGIDAGRIGSFLDPVWPDVVNEYEALRAHQSRHIRKEEMPRIESLFGVKFSALEEITFDIRPPSVRFSLGSVPPHTAHQLHVEFALLRDCHIDFQFYETANADMALDYVSVDY